MDLSEDEKDHKGFERLLVEEVFYLSREDGNDIFITEEQTSELKRHQHRGLRFLYRQYKMKKPGVIMNDASGFGKKVQTAVFLDAIKQTLSEPALILCNEIERDNWKYYFMHFGRDYKEILSFDATLPTSNMKIFIRSFDDLETVIKKTWSIVVIDDPVAIKMFKPLKNLKAAFKIWVVSIDLKHNLNTFAAINDWVNPNNTFSIQDFTPKNKSADEIVGKAILLDRYFEELVLSRGHEAKKDKKKQPNKMKSSTTKKNKDPTGTKTKKSTANTVNKPNTPIAGTSRGNATVKRNWKGKNYSNSSDESWEESGAAKRNKKTKGTPNPKLVAAKLGNINKATSNSKAVTAKGTKLNKLKFGFDCDDDNDDISDFDDDDDDLSDFDDERNDLSDFDDEEDDFDSFTSDEEKGEMRFMAKQHFKTEPYYNKLSKPNKTKKYAANVSAKKGVGIAKKSLGSAKKGLKLVNKRLTKKGVVLTHKDVGAESSKSLQNQSKDSTRNTEEINDFNSMNDSVDFELNTIPIEAKDDVRNNSDVLVFDVNLEVSNISKNNSNQELNTSGSQDKEDYKKAFKEKESNKNNSQNNDTSLPQANISSKLDVSIIDTKIRDLEEKTSAQFKGSFLDQLLDSNKTSPKSIAANSSADKISKKSVEIKNNDELMTSPKSSISKVKEKDKPSSPVIIASQSPIKGSPQKIDDQIKELEQTTYDKFKGSVLDKLF